MSRRKFTAGSMKGVGTATDKKKNNFKPYTLPNGVEVLNLNNYKVKDEDTVIKADVDFLLYEVTDKAHPSYEHGAGYYRPYNTHYIDKKSVVCPSTFGKKCPICEAKQRVSEELGVFIKGTWATLSDAQKSTINALGIKDRAIYPILMNGKFCLADFSYNCLHAKLLEEFQSDTKGVADTFFLDDDGLTAGFRFNFVEKGKIKYWEGIPVTWTERKPIDDEVLDLIDSIKLDDMFEVKSYEELETLLNESGLLSIIEEEDEIEDEEDEVVEEVTQKTTRRPRKVKEVVVEEDEDEEEDEDDVPWDDEEEEEEAPSVISGRRRRR